MQYKLETIKRTKIAKKKGVDWDSKNRHDNSWCNLKKLVIIV